jgi:phospholipid/cholesterol/gamma-HCH transport system substrate-binding protein
MESQANYVAIGAFVLLVLAGIVAAALWLAGAELNPHYAVYETHIPGSVAGLDTGAPVKVNGIDVGHVASIEQDARNPADVNVILQIRPDATIRSDSVASLEMQGLTGGRYVEITGGTFASPKLSAEPGQRYPTIAARQSSLDALFDDAPRLMKNLNVIANRLQALLDDRNRRAIDQTLASLRDLTTSLDQHSQDLDHMLADGDSALQNLAKASTELNTLLEHFQGTPAELDRLIASANLLADNLNDVVRTGRPGLHELTTTVPARLDALLTLATRLTASLDRLSAELERNPSSVLFGVNQQGYRPR